MLTTACQTETCQTKKVTKKVIVQQPCCKSAEVTSCVEKEDTEYPDYSADKFWQAGHGEHVYPDFWCGQRKVTYRP